MKVSELQILLIDHLKPLLPEWKFVKSRREFKLKKGEVVWFLHLSCINHSSDFDAVADVAVEFLSGKQRVCVIGAELGNIKGVGQTRFPVSNPKEALVAAQNLYCFFEEIGMPFLKRFSEPAEVVSVLESGSEEAMLISTLNSEHKDQIRDMRQHYPSGM